MLGELAATNVSLDGPTVLAGGEAGTIPAVLGVPRLVVAVALVVGVLVLLRLRPGGSSPTRPPLPGRPKSWSWPRIGLGLGVVTVAGWLLAGVGGSSFGPSTVGAANSVQAGRVNWWLVAFLFGIVLGAQLSARQSRQWRPRGENPVRYLQLAAGGFLLGAGGWIAGGCNLGHGVSGAAQLNVSSWVVVAAMALGVLAAGKVRSKAASPSSWLPTPTR